MQTDPEHDELQLLTDGLNRIDTAYTIKIYLLKIKTKVELRIDLHC